MLVVSLVELKSRTPKFNDLQEKFDNAVTATELILKKQNIKKNYKIILILLAKSFNKKPSNSPIAQGLKVKIQGRRRPVVHGKCGKQLLDIISNEDQTRHKNLYFLN